MLCKKGSPSLLQSWVQVIVQFVQIYVIKIVVTVTSTIPKMDFRIDKVSLETLQNTYIFLLNVNFENLIIRLHDKYGKLLIK